MENLRELADLSENINPFFWNIGVITASILIGLILKLIFRKILLLTRTNWDYQILGIVLKHLRKPTFLFFPVLTLIILYPLLKMEGELKARFLLINNSLLIVSIAWILVAIIRILEDYFINYYAISKEDNIRERRIRTQYQFVRRLIMISIIFVAISVILLQFESVRRIGSTLLTSAGIAGVILGFAAQKSIANLLAGFQIAFTQPIRLDDVVVVENEWGRIEEINLTYVVVRIWDQRRLILPINYFIEKPFQNWTRTSADIWGTVYIYTDYRIPVDELRKSLKDWLSVHPKWDGKVGGIQVTDVRENTIELRALMSARNSGDAWDLRCDIREKLVKLIEEKYPEALPLTRAEVTGGLTHPDPHFASQSGPDDPATN